MVPGVAGEVVAVAGDVEAGPVVEAG